MLPRVADSDVFAGRCDSRVRSSAPGCASSAFAKPSRQHGNGRGHSGADAPTQIGAQSRVRLLYTFVAGIALALHPDDPRGAAL